MSLPRAMSRPSGNHNWVRRRVEHEDNALKMGRHAGRVMAGADEPYQHLPFFYSDLFDHGYEAVGEIDARLDTTVDWQDPYKEGVIYYLQGDVIRGVLLGMFGKWSMPPDISLPVRNAWVIAIRPRFRRPPELASLPDCNFPIPA